MENTTQYFDIHLTIVGVANYLQHVQTATNPYPIPDISQWAFHRLHARQVFAGDRPSLTVRETLAYLTKPIEELFAEDEIPPELSVYSLVNKSLYGDGHFDLDPIVLEYLDESDLSKVHEVRNLVDELDNQPMRSFRKTFLALYDQAGISTKERQDYDEQYRKVRRFLSQPQNSITDPITLMMTFEDDWQNVQADYFRPCSEVHHRIVDRVNGQEAYRICERCGPLYHNTLGNLEPIYTCPPDCPGIGHAHAVDANPSASIIRYAHQKRVLISGVPELRLYSQLQQRAYIVQDELQLYPGIDRYDIRVVFNDGKIHALDVKDHVLPYSLARNLKPPKWKDYEAEWVAYDAMYYLIPLNRVQDMKNKEGYMKPLEEAAKDFRNVHVMTIEDYLKRIDHVYKHS